jgi:UDP-N-acetylglucosamine 4,6-dehydratase
MARILITGGSGFLGQHLAEQLHGSHEVIISSRNQKQMLSAAHHLGVEAVPLDVSNCQSTIEIFQRLKPDIVVHAAATKFVDLAEKYPNEAIDINIIGSQNVARAAMQTGVEHVIGISTDKAAAPIYNLYGMTKATMERLFVSLNSVTKTKFSIVRYGNVAWSTGSVFPIWKKMLEDKNHIVSTGPDMSRFFFSVSEAVTLVHAALDNMDVVEGKVLSLPMKGTELQRILNIWVTSMNATWSLGERRPGDRDLEYLLSEAEAEVTKRIELSGRPYFLLDPKQKTPIEDRLLGAFSSRSAEQFTDLELKELIFTAPADRFL